MSKAEECTVSDRLKAKLGPAANFSTSVADL